MNKPKIKGTAAETALATYLQISGFPYAERRSLQGASDKGDITGTPGICWECKVADAGFQLSGWLRETRTERDNSRSMWGVLVCKPKGMGARSVAMWPTFMRQEEHGRLRDAVYDATGIIGDDAILPVSKIATIVPTLKAHPTWGLVYTPPGYANQPDGWYVALTLETMIKLLRQAGFGDPVGEDS